MVGGSVDRWWVVVWVMGVEEGGPLQHGFVMIGYWGCLLSGRFGLRHAVPPITGHHPRPRLEIQCTELNLEVAWVFSVYSSRISPD